MADRFDLDAIDADDALLDLLAAGGESAVSAGEHDPAVKLLADLRLAVEVEDELPVETIDDPESFLARCAALNPMTDPFARKVAARGLALGVAAVAALSVSGVAAAVTGDPLSPYEKVIEKVVDAVRPQTSFPKEQLDGMPVLDKTKIVKVGKDYREKVLEQKAAEDQGKVDSVAQPIPPAAVVQKETPDILQRAIPPLVNQPTATQVEPTIPATTQAPDKTDDKTPTDTTTEQPPATDQPTTQPTQPPDTTTTPPPADTTTPPSDPSTTPPPDTTTPPANDPSSEAGTGGGETSTGDPTTAPSGDSTGDTQPQTGTTQPGSDSTGTDTTTGPTGSDPLGSSRDNLPDTPPLGTPPIGEPPATPPADTTSPPATPSADTSVDPVAEVAKVVENVLAPVLPTASGEAAQVQSAEQFFGGDAQTAAAKHSSGKITTGSVRASYPKGKHSTGLYPEGKHAAIDRTHGSTDDANVLKILGVVNKPLV
jgi:hypothetical protein